MKQRSRLLSISIRNIGCIGTDPVEIALDQIVCLVGKNNAGKSTVLTAYELARGKQAFTHADRHQHATPEDPSEIVLEVHIPAGLGNVDEKWKVPRDGLLVVKSRWLWSPDDDYKRKRETWSPQLNDGAGGWDPDEKAGGFDSVFGSRLPEPIRIGSLDDATRSEPQLLEMALTPLSTEIATEVAQKGSILQSAIVEIQSRVDGLAKGHAEHFTKIAGRVASGVSGVFPALSVSLTLSPNAPSFEFEKLLRDGAKISIHDGKTITDPKRQGTGAKRTLFWGMVQVLSEMARDKAELDTLRKTLAKQQKALKDAKPAGQEKARLLVEETEAAIKKRSSGAPNEQPDDPTDVAFPGYILLIDEPENALHPMAARAAQRYLYDLAKAGDWQVIITTHSPYFVNPFEDHTTIVRMDRGVANGGMTVTKVYRSDHVQFEGNEKQQLQALQHIDPSFSEVFFGSYPVIVEGDTEHAAFIAAAIESAKPIANTVTPVRARGKALIIPLIKVLRHFKIPFGVLHDSDSPFIDNGNASGAWTENGKIWEEINKTRNLGIDVRHRVSVPDFERRMNLPEASDGKPLAMYLQIKAQPEMQEAVESLMHDLLDGANHCAVGGAANKADFSEKLLQQVTSWAKDNGMDKHIRFAGK